MIHLRIENGLPIASLTLLYQNKSLQLHHVLFDTGCAATIFDTDLLDIIGMKIDIKNGTAKRMYGIGGASEICYEQIVSDFTIGS
jgi:hypothetical protein